METQLNVNGDRDDRQSLRQRHHLARGMIQLPPSFRDMHKVPKRINSYNRQVITVQETPMDLGLQR